MSDPKIPSDSVGAKLNSETLTIVTWLWYDRDAKQKFKPYHVERWADMVRSNLTIPHQLVCITDSPDKINGVDTFKIWDPPKVKSRQWHRGRPQCYRRIMIFDPANSGQFGTRHIVSMDLDMVVTGNLDPLFEKRYDFKIMQGGGNRNPYNGSMWMFEHEAMRRINDRFTVEEALKASTKFMGSDQAWFRYVLGEGHKVWNGPTDGAYQFATMHRQRGSRSKLPDNCRLVFFAGAKKPWHVPIQKAYPWVHDHYGRTPEFESKSMEHVREQARRPVGRSRTRAEVRKLESRLESVLDKQGIPIVKIPDPVETPKPLNPADGGVFWVHMDKGGWGLAIFLEAFKKGWDVRSFGSPNDITEPGYVFFKVSQDSSELPKHKEIASSLQEQGCLLIPDLFTIQEYEDKGLQALRYPDWMPHTEIIYDAQMAIARTKEISYPVVSKARTGSASKAVRVHNEAKTLVTEIHTLFSSGIETNMGELQKDYVMLQEFLPGNSHAWRVTRIGSKHFIIRVENRSDEDPRASGSGKMTQVDPADREPTEVLAFAKDFFDSNRLSWCAIDIVRDHKRGKWRVLETSIAWTMYNPKLNPKARFAEDDRLAAHMFEIAIEEIENGNLGP